MKLILTILRGALWGVSRLTLAVLAFAFFGVGYTLLYWATDYQILAALILGTAVFALSFWRERRAARKRIATGGAGRPLPPMAAAGAFATFALILGIVGFCWFPVRRVAVLATWPMGSAGVPIILRAALDGETSSQVRLRFQSLGERAQSAVPTLITWMDSPDPKRYHAAAELLGAIGPAAAPAAPAVGRAIRDRRITDVHVLYEMGAAALPEYMQILQSADATRHNEALRGIAQLGPAAASVAPELARQLVATGGGYDNQKYELMPALKAIGPAGAAALPILIAELDNATGYAYGKKDAAIAIANLGPAAAPATAALIRALKVDQARGAAIGALGAIGPAAADAIPAIVDLIQRDVANTFSDVDPGQCIGKIGGPAALAALRDLLTHPPADLKHADRQIYSAVRGLREMGPAAAPAIEELRAAARRNSSSWDRMRVAETLWTAGDTQTPLDMLREFLALPSQGALAPGSASDVTGAASSLLELLGPAAKPLAPLIIARIDVTPVSEQYTSDSLINPLYRIDPAGTVQYLTRTGRKPPLRNIALIRDLGQRGLDACIASIRAGERYEAPFTLRELGPDAKPVIADILKLNDEGLLGNGDTRGILKRVDTWAYLKFDGIALAIGIAGVAILCPIIEWLVFGFRWSRRAKEPREVTFMEPVKVE